MTSAAPEQDAGFTWNRPAGPARGWGVLDPAAGIRVETVSASRRAAMVNWLWLRSPCPPLADWSDARVERAFALLAPPLGCRLVAVEIREGGEASSLRAGDPPLRMPGDRAPAARARSSR